MSTVLKWGIVGAANIAGRVGNAMRLAGHEIVAIGTRTHERGAGLAERIAPAATIYEDYESVLADEQVEAVYIPLPNHLHREWTVRAAQAGKHVLCEKPLALNRAEVAEMVRACDEAGVLLAEAVFFHYGVRHRAIKQLVADGIVGGLVRVSVDFSFQLRGEGNIRWWDRSMGGGALYDIGSHALNWLLWLFEEEPTGVTATSTPGSGADVTTAVSLEFSGGRTAQAWVSFGAAPMQTMVVVGDSGYLEVPRPIGVWQVGEEPPGTNMGCVLVRGAEREAIDLPGGENPYVGMVEAFAESVRTGAPIETDAAAACRTLRVIEACQDAVAPALPPQQALVS